MNTVSPIAPLRLSVPRRRLARVQAVVSNNTHTVDKQASGASSGSAAPLRGEVLDREESALAVQPCGVVLSGRAHKAVEAVLAYQQNQRIESADARTPGRLFYTHT